MKKSVVIAGLTLATIGAIGSTTLAFASDARGPNNPESGLSAKIAEAFNLQQSDVQNVVDQYHNQQQSDRLQTMVDDGTITAEQKTLVENKLVEIQPRLDEIRAMTDDTARHDAMSQLRTELQQWETDNNVQVPLPGLGHRGVGMGRGEMNRTNDS